MWFIYCSAQGKLTPMSQSTGCSKSMQTHLKVAEAYAAQFSHDKHRQVGVILLHGTTQNIIAMATNTLPRYISDKDGKRLQRPAKYNYLIHAEISAICAAASNGTSTEGCTAVLTLFPCSACARAMIQCGCRHIVCPNIAEDAQWDAEWVISRELLTEAGVDITFMSSESDKH